METDRLYTANPRVTYASTDHATVNSATVDGAAFASGDRLAYNQTLHMGITPNVGYKISSVNARYTGSVGIISAGQTLASTGTYDFTGVQADATIDINTDTIPNNIVWSAGSGVTATISGGDLTYDIETTSITMPATHERAGYTLTGWTLSKDTGVNGGSLTEKTYATTDTINPVGTYGGTLTFTAVWAADAQSVTKNPDTITLSPTTPKTNETVTVTIPAKDGYTISNPGITVTKDSNSTPVNVTNAGDELDTTWAYIHPPEAVTVTAQYTPINYSITWKTGYGPDDGTVITGDGFTTSYNIKSTTITKPTDPTRPGYRFAGWQLKDAAAYGDTGALNAATATMDAITFKNVYDTHLVVVATWTANTFTVKFDANTTGLLGTVTGTMEDEDFEYGTAEALTTNAYVLTGYTFSGWNTKADGSTLTTDNNGTVTLYARWTVDTQTVATSSDHGTLSVSNTSPKTNYKVTVTVTPDTGYTLDTVTVYKTNEEAITVKTTQTDGTYMFTQPGYPVTVQATYTANTYTVTLDGNDATTTGTASVTATYNSSTLDPATITNPARNGYTFAGWTATLNGTDVVIGTNGALVRGVNGYTDESGKWTNTENNVTLYAKWTGITYTITYNTDGGTPIADGWRKSR